LASAAPAARGLIMSSIVVLHILACMPNTRSSAKALVGKYEVSHEKISRRDMRIEVRAPKLKQGSSAKPLTSTRFQHMTCSIISAGQLHGTTFVCSI
jgi:hypothetical protein